MSAWETSTRKGRMASESVAVGFGATGTCDIGSSCCARPGSAADRELFLAKRRASNGRTPDFADALGPVSPATGMRGYGCRSAPDPPQPKVRHVDALEKGPFGTSTRDRQGAKLLSKI